MPPARPRLTFKTGDRVAWKGQGRMFFGTVVAVVPALQDPVRYVPKHLVKHDRFNWTGLGRRWESYIVDSHGNAYWPQVATMQHATAEVPQ